MTISTWIVVCYLVGVTLVGVLLAGRNRSSADWATGSGNVGVVMIAVGIAGSRIGGVGTYGVAGDVIDTGLWNLWYGINTFLAFLLVGFFYAIPYRRLRLTTVGEIFIRRFDSARARILTSLCVQTEYFIINIIEAYLIGNILAVMLGIPLVYGIYLGTLVVFTYTSVSGIRGTSYTNFIHCSVIILGLSSIAVVTLQDIGGWNVVVAKVDAALTAADKDPASWWSLTGLGWLPIIAMFFSATIHTPGASIYVNYASAARSERVLIPAFILAGLLAALMPFLSALVGLETLAVYGSDESISGYANITRLATDAGPVLGGLALAAILAALISSAGPVLLTGSTLFVNDWIPGSDDFSPRKKLVAYRITSVVYCLIGATIAAVASIASVLDLLLFAFAMVVPPAIAVTFVIYWKRTTEQGVYWGMATGYVAGLVTWLVNESSGSVIVDPSYLTTLVPLVVVPVVSLLDWKALTPAPAFYRMIAGEAAAQAE